MFTELIKKNLKWLIVAIMIMGFLAGCGDQYEENREPAIDNVTVQEHISEDANALGVAKGEQSSVQSVETEPLSMDVVSGDQTLERKVIREQYLEQQVDDIEKALSNVEKQVERVPGAYIENWEEWKVESRHQIEHRAHIVLRVPTDSYQSLLTEVENQGVVTRRKMSGQDVTEEYIDNESRLRNRTAHEERILDLYEQAETIEDLLKLESELSRIRESIEVLEGRQQYLEHVTSTVKLSIELFEVEEEYMIASGDSSILEASKAGFISSLKRLKGLGEQGIILLISGLPYLMVILLILVLLYLFIGKRILSRKKEKERLGGNDQE